MSISPDLEPLKKRVEEFPQNELFRFSLGKACFDQQLYAEAIQHFEIALQKKADWMAVAILLGKSHLQLNQTEKAKEYLRLGQRLAQEQKHEGPFEETTTLLAQIQ
jgi:uncharacterized protein HemY